MTDAAPPRAPDRPPVPRPRRSWVVTIYAIAASAVIGWWVVTGMSGAAIGTSTERDAIPTGVRSSPGGYRSFHFWHSGYQGGK